MRQMYDVVEEFLKCRLSPFTKEEFNSYLKKYRIKLLPEEISQILYGSELVFSLVNDMFLTRAGAFTDQLFSFMPTREEAEKGVFVPGHRFMPFIDPQIYGFNCTLFLKNKKILKETVSITMNTALDIHAFYGEGYVLPYILGDPANENVELSSLPYGMPYDVCMTAYSLEPYFEKGFQLGDRILCKVVDWKNSIIETEILPGKRGALKVTQADVEREEWYSIFEEALLSKFPKCGPTRSIEEQLAFLFLEEQKSLCTRNCGSSEEFLQHTTEINFTNYGLESRIWKSNEAIPFVGDWNRQALKDHPLPDIEMYFSEFVIDSFIKNNLYQTDLEGDPDKIMDDLFPKSLPIDDFERHFIMTHLKKRIDVVQKLYNRAIDYPMNSTRKKILALFQKVCDLSCAVGCSGIDFEEFPGQEMIILAQVFTHIARMLEEIEVNPEAAENEKNDILLSLDGLAETFEEIEYPIRAVLKKAKFVI